MTGTGIYERDGPGCTSPKKEEPSHQEVVLTDVDRNLLMALTPGLGSDANDVLHYIMRTWMLEHMGLDWIRQHSLKRQSKE